MKKGFTLVELLVSITIVAILATVGLVAYRQVIDQANLTKTQSLMRELRIMMENYRTIYGKLPPVVLPSGCTDYYSTLDSGCPGWNTILDTLESAGILKTVDKPKYTTDGWGQPFGYVNHDGVKSTTFSLFWTFGLNKTTDRNLDQFNEGTNCGGDDWCLDLPYGK